MLQDPANGEKMGQREGFSKGDITKINNMYGCPERTPGSKEPWSGPSQSQQGNGGNLASNILGGLLSIFTGREEE